jgi:hypothetical protein
VVYLRASNSAAALEHPPEVAYINGLEILESRAHAVKNAGIIHGGSPRHV